MYNRERKADLGEEASGKIRLMHTLQTILDLQIHYRYSSDVIILTAIFLRFKIERKNFKLYFLKIFLA